MICPSTMKSSCKCYAALDYIVNNPGCSTKDIANHMHKVGKDADSAICTCLDNQWVVTHKPLFHGVMTFTATLKGKTIVKKIAKSIDFIKSVREFVSAVVNANVETAEELDIQLALVGSHKFVEYDFLKFIYDLFKKPDAVENSEAFLFLKDHLSMPLLFEIYAKAKEVVMNHKRQDSKEVA